MVLEGWPSCLRLGVEEENVNALRTRNISKQEKEERQEAKTATEIEGIPGHGLSSRYGVDR